METTEPIAALEAAALEQLKRHGLVQPGDRVIAAVSGGADSMALLLFFLRCGPALGLTVEVAHVDHGLRGVASARDAAFVAAFCRARGVPLHRFSAPEEGVVPPKGPGKHGRGSCAMAFSSGCAGSMGQSWPRPTPKTTRPKPCCCTWPGAAARQVRPASRPCGGRSSGRFSR